MKYIVISYDGIGFSVAYKLLCEGKEVLVGQIKNVWELGNDDKPEEPEKKKRRLSVYDGVFPKYDMPTLLTKLRQIKNKDEYFVFVDFNNLWKIAEQVKKMGFKNGFFPTKEDFELEKDRNKAKDIVKKHYKDVEVGEVHEFKKAQDGIKFIQESDKFLVLKGDDPACETVCPTDKILELAKQKLIDTLETLGKDYEKKGFILEEKLTDPMEITPEAMFYNGKFVSATIDIESKTMCAGDIGGQTGCSQNLVFTIKESDPVFKIAFPKYVYDQAKKHQGLFVWDCSLLIKDKPYFGEFCANRFGWDAIQTELSMCESVSSFFENIVKGKNPYKYQYGVAVRGFNIDRHDDDSPLKDKSILWLDKAEKNLWIYDLKIKDGKPVNAGHWNPDVAVFTGQGSMPEEAVKIAHKTIEMFSFPNLIHRDEDDFMCKDYKTSIGTRYEFYKTNF